MTNKFYAVGKVAGGRPRLTTDIQARLSQFCNKLEGETVLVTVSKLSRRRSDEFIGLFWVRLKELTDYSGESPTRLTELLWRRCGLGTFEQEDEIGEMLLQNDPESREAMRFKVRRFFRESRNDILNDDLLRIFEAMEQLCNELNEGVDPDRWLVLSAGRQNWKKVAAARRNM